MSNLNWNKVEWENIFGIVRSVDGLKRNQTRPLRTEIIEMAIDKYSGNQLKYVGETVDGMDFEGSDGLRYECKSAGNMFPKTSRGKATTKQTLKNHRSAKKELEKTFDFMIVMDTTLNKVGITPWEKMETFHKDAVIDFKIPLEDVRIVAENVIPDSKRASVDFSKELKRLIYEYL